MFRSFFLVFRILNSLLLQHNCKIEEIQRNKSLELREQGAIFNFESYEWWWKFYYFPAEGI